MRRSPKVVVECILIKAIALMDTEKALKHTDPAYLHSDLTDIALGAYYRVYNGMGFGFLESVYRNALAKELTKAGRGFRTRSPRGRLVRCGEGGPLQG
jgi:hypothetical protein